MKISKLYKLCFAIAVAAVTSVVVSNDVAAYKNADNNSIKEMMNRRRNGLKPQAKVSGHSSSAVAKSAPVYNEYKEETATEQTLSSENSWFNFNSGPIFDTGSCSTNHKSGPIFDTGPCKKCKAPAPVAKPQPKIANYVVEYNDFIHQAVARDCCSMAPLYLDHVDFRLSDIESSFAYGNKLGNYRFRIFGCRRFDKEAILNQGRILEKNMNFSKVFEDVTGDCYNLVKMPEDLCLQDTPSAMPEYVLSAEITDFYMNVCDGYDYKDTKKTDSRSGSAEITVTWRLTDLTKTKVLWEGQTTGYSDVLIGQENGEIELIEKAFADAAVNLRNMSGFEEQLMVRLTPEELSNQRQALIDEEIALNPAKCQLKEEQNLVKQCQISRQEINIMQCPAVVEQTIVVDKCEVCNVCPTCDECNVLDCVPEVVVNQGVVVDNAIFDNCIDQNGGVISGGDCQVVDDTWVDMKNGDKVFDSLCIVDRPPYETLDAQNLYKVRASVVEISNMSGKKGVGLIVSENFVLTSANLVDKNNNVYKLKTINGKELSGKAVRVNLSKNTALIMLDEETKYTPLSLNLDLPKVGQGGFMTLGMLDVENFEDGENYLDNNGKVTGYRYSEDKGSEIMLDTYVQDVTIGGVLIDANGTITGMAHTGKKTDSGTDLYLPTETALRSLGLSICEKLYEKVSPWQQTVYKPVTELILKSEPKAPEEMTVEERK
ncbi:MAG: hypothetical protein IJF12_04400 [Alphaproteobacteria bacterium]|nr:hypothetical protein [Alphaproteobacteria bacterium]